MPGDNSNSDIELRRNLPKHIAIIMDGNGRWAKQRHLPRFAGHRAGVEAVREVVKNCAKYGIEVLSLFAFSSENWRRPEQEVGLLMELLYTALGREVDRLHDNNVKLRIVGERSAFSQKLQKRLLAAEQRTSDNTGLTLVVAVNYGGRWDVAEAAKQLCQKVEAGQISSVDITPQLLADHITLSDLPEPDLFIRTGGEKRVSNFMLWQLAYTELYFTDTFWPDFDTAAFNDALNSFSSRERRFGQTSEQVEQVQGA